MTHFSGKKAILSLLCALLLLGGLSTALAVSAVTARLSPDFTIVIDGSVREFYNAGGQEVHPILYDGTTYLPVRAIGELMGKNVDWNQDTKTVTLSGQRTAAAVSGTPDAAARPADVSAELRDDFTVIVDGTSRTFADANGKTVYPLLYNGSTYLPVRAIGELMGKSVAWDSATSTVTLSGSLVTDADSFSGGTGTPASTDAPAGLISLEDAKAKALEHAGVKASDVTFLEQKLDWDDGRQIYELEFCSPAAEADAAQRTKYDCEIDAATGAVVKFSQESKSLSLPAPVSGTSITRERAQAIALGKVPGADASHVTKLKADTEDGRPVYEVEIVYSGMEYDFEIDAAGTILEMDSERAD